MDIARSSINRTTTALLNDLAGEGDEGAWAELDTRFRPVLFALARRLGLSEPDAADATQEALTRVVRAYRGGQYDRARGRLGSWILGIARHAIADVRRARGREIGSTRDDVGEVSAPDESERVWEQELRAELFRRAMGVLREQSRADERTLRAFELTLDGRLSAEHIAQELGMTRNDVYVAKHRCLTKLRELMEADRELMLE